MIIYDVQCRFNKSPKLTKFNGGANHLGERYQTYKSFKKAKGIVMSGLKDELVRIQLEIDELNTVNSADDLELSSNPFDGSM